MLAAYKETETSASRVIYINSKDATAIMGDNRSDFNFTLEEPIVVPEHHSIIMSVFSAEIPYSFYNFREGINCTLDYVVGVFNTPADYTVAGFLDPAQAGIQQFTLPEGNYNAVELAARITAGITDLECLYDHNKLKFSFRCLTKGFRITLALRNGVNTGTPDNPGEDMNEELGFDWFNILGDPWVEQDPAGLGPRYYGYSNPNPGAGIPPPFVAGPGIDNNTAGPFLLPPDWFLYSDDVADVTNSIRSLFIRTNLSTTSILDSHIGGGFSNILCRVPINVGSGGVINIDPVNGDVHKLLLKIKTITNIAIRLTNQKNETINLNGLDFDISLKLEFIEPKELPVPPNVREVLYQESQNYQEKQALLETKKLKQNKPEKKKKKNKA
tara:strand:+ start:3674 stop:4828 length:1155 start_codon:yes stop_codon:yes gene_type:complete